VPSGGRAPRPFAAALAAAAVTLVLLGLAANAAAAAPWQVADTIDANLFDAQTALLLDERSDAAGALADAERSVSGAFERDLRRDAPRALAGLRSALADARAARASGDEVALAAARGKAIAALREGAFGIAVAAARRGDAAQARAWLLVRDFRQSTRFTRPGVDATAALIGMRAGDVVPADAALAVRKDLLDAYQSRLATNLDDAAQAGERGFAPRFAETAALAAGYWRILAPEYRDQRGSVAAADTARYFEALESAAAAALSSASK